MIEKIYKLLHGLKKPYGAPDLLYDEVRVMDHNFNLSYFESNQDDIIKWYKKNRPWVSAVMVSRAGRIIAEKHFRKMVWFVSPNRYESEFLRWIEIWRISYEPMKEVERR